MIYCICKKPTSYYEHVTASYKLLNEHYNSNKSSNVFISYHNKIIAGTRNATELRNKSMSLKASGQVLTVLDRESNIV